MLTSISPLGERARGNTYVVTVSWLTLGAIAGGACVGAVVAAVGYGLGFPGWSVEWRLALLAIAAMTAAIWDLSKLSLGGHRQVNEDWLTAFRGWVYGGGFGLQLGSGVATVINTALVPLFLLTALLGAGVMQGLVIGATFGGVRGLSVLANRGVRSAADLRVLHRRLDVADRVSKQSAAAVVSVVGALTLIGLTI